MNVQKFKECRIRTVFDNFPVSHGQPRRGVQSKGVQRLQPRTREFEEGCWTNKSSYLIRRSEPILRQFFEHGFYVVCRSVAHEKLARLKAWKSSNGKVRPFVAQRSSVCPSVLCSCAQTSNQPTRQPNPAYSITHPHTHIHTSTSSSFYETI